MHPAFTRRRETAISEEVERLYEKKGMDPGETQSRPQNTAIMTAAKSLSSVSYPSEITTSILPKGVLPILNDQSVNQLLSEAKEVGQDITLESSALMPIADTRALVQRSKKTVEIDMEVLESLQITIHRITNKLDERE